jgi:hypothetical protein
MRWSPFVVACAVLLAGCASTPSASAPGSTSASPSTTLPTTGAPGPKAAGPSIQSFGWSGELVDGVWACEFAVDHKCAAQPVDAAYGIGFEVGVEGHAAGGTVTLTWTASNQLNANLNMAVWKTNATASVPLGTDAQGPSPLAFTVPATTFRPGDALRVDVYSAYTQAGPAVVGVSTRQPFQIEGQLTLHKA